MARYLVNKQISILTRPHGQKSIKHELISPAKNPSQKEVRHVDFYRESAYHYSPDFGESLQTHSAGTFHLLLAHYHTSTGNDHLAATTAKRDGCHAHGGRASDFPADGV